MAGRILTVAAVAAATAAVAAAHPVVHAAGHAKAVDAKDGHVQHYRRPREPFTPDVPVKPFFKLEKGHPVPVWQADASAGAEAIARQFLAAHTPGVDVSEAGAIVTDSYTTKHNGVQHVYLRQRIAGVPVTNAVANVNIRNGRVLSAYSRFYTGAVAGPLDELTRPRLTAERAAQRLARYLRVAITGPTKVAAKGDGYVLTVPGLSLDDIPAELNFIVLEGGDRLALVWHLTVRSDDWWYHVHVDANDGTVHSLIDWVADGTYLALPIGTNDPSDGPRVYIEEPILEASPVGWHDQSGPKYTTTIGNNVYAQENWSGSSSGWEDNHRPSGGAENYYDFPYDDVNLQPEEYVNASITNLFVWNNLIHDVFYQYGFDEVSGNFQESNFGRGGKEVDAVQANGQDGAGMNNANFATPPDGQRPRMRMYNYDMTDPMRDGCFAVGTVIHEYSHGISNRLTGGPDNSNCLGAGQSGGMGEGWGDFFSVVFRQRANYTRDNDWAFGGWQRDMPEGIRPYLYSTKMEVNPTTYEIINTPDFSGVHAKGCVWANALYEGYWNIVDEEGWVEDIYSRQGGNGIVLQDVVDGMKLQPCNPTFLEARDAILLADETNYAGRNVCRWWRAFAKRGMGLYASTTATRATEDFTVPPDCEEAK